MKRFLYLSLTLLTLLLCSNLWAAGTCTNGNSQTSAGITEYSWSWTSDASGDVSGGYTQTVSGLLLGAKAVPSSASYSPTDLYDLKLVDDTGLDVFIGAGADMPQSYTSTSNYFTPLTSEGGYVPLRGTVLTPEVSNAGNAKKGAIYIYVQ